MLKLLNIINKSMNKTHKINALNIIKRADPKKSCISDNLDDILELKNTKPLKNKVFINSLREPHNQDKPIKSLGGAPKGRIPWNKGLTKADPRVKANHEKSVATKKANGFYASHKPPPPANVGDNNYMRSPEGRKQASERAKKRWAQIKKKNPSHSGPLI